MDIDSKRKYFWMAVIVGVIVVLDQVTKYLVLEKIPLHRSIPVIPGFFSLTHIHNPGGAFGFFAQGAAAWRHWLFLGAGFFALGLIFYFYHQTPKERPFLRLSLGLIFGGAVGNIIDRLRFGEVVDFLLFYVGQWQWPAFNVADSAVSVGVVIFILHIVFKKMPF
ncbi:MAG: signal peptidase II [Desulfobacteraceae bacterium]|nr:signal peptidase II [Desulfobacteraceae bacterium]